MGGDYGESLNMAIRAEAVRDLEEASEMIASAVSNIKYQIESNGVDSDRYFESFGLAVNTHHVTDGWQQLQPGIVTLFETTKKNSLQKIKSAVSGRGLSYKPWVFDTVRSNEPSQGRHEYQMFVDYLERSLEIERGVK